ncbi:MAG TPA: elongation factor P--(R)-beta-lysine ligase [Persephonella sp.]|uniref:Lysine--tRNA ligase n=1 Tax=Persephonella marina (strain DSM 14350 / EX-H1) TaxID=123214 RepID=C0QQD5_PERMH|nr:MULTISPECIES: elongation factor P--(R)-beta-lysine ligase [Persephonella]ACO04898.1 lysine--tRNA ligase [Persephonella marina EX-H1]HCB69513.1 elongation factor P--(R)-beta-lysine ligase [Persephonella sp.]
MFYLEKSKILKGIRDYFERTGAIEVFTDILRLYPNLDAHILPVELFFNDNEGRKRGFLHTSPEYEMKRILSEIKRDIYQITKVFRNFESSKKHKIEFTMLEWYRVGYNLDDIMDDTQNIFIESAISLYKKPVVTYMGKRYDLRESEKITVDEAFYRFTSVYPDRYEDMIRFLKEKEDIKEEIDYEEAFFRIYAFYVEPNLGKEKLTFIYNYPTAFASLSKIENNRGKRFEAYINGLELVNGYHELTDPEKVKNILEREALRKKEETGKDYPVDYRFIEITEDLPDCSGASLGIDRLFMVLLNKSNIKDI